ncbi:MSHA biogenesis protein MshP [uncultured Photobacterium sp.]|uniref:MSHA biogenesis protein MshP n=1 Tax=uncultured Photobacterium sp. TaxID=173973 RepID=UPI0026095121|nr:MSHA biogenesis protein MshP [uncultured Photobacterium sp.]
MYRRRQQGSALVVAIFVITVMAVMAAALIKINWSQSDTTTREVLGARAWLAANSGIEWGLNRLFPIGDPSAIGACDNTNPPFANTADFHDCRITVGCKLVDVTYDGETVSQYHLESTGSCGSGIFEVQRIQETWAKRLKP